ncbi:MAG: MBL fold metallo-hydrolase [Treponema sp.]|jgi:glyoxylase-like metal-dependent hydrolase (beta-lactamase superfamily II)|nr:MBL fold metallo-hydrolase [Treponema sp.]
MKGMMVLGLVFGAVAVMGCGTSKQQVQGSAFSESDGIFSCKVGDFEVFMVVEAQREGNAGILVGASEAILQQFIPEAGFMHSTNVFLIKTPEKNILIDTAFGGFVEKMKRLGVEPGQIDTVLITHLHGDHFGGLQKDGEAVFSNAKVYVPAKDVDHFTRVQVNSGAVAALAPYGSNVETFEPANLGSTLSEIVPGISPIAAYGHTPGHTAYLVANGNDKLLIAADFLHVGLVQFPMPDISATYDMDAQAAAATRRQLLGYAEQHKIPIGGMHIVYPAVGTVEADGSGFRFVPRN